METMPKNKLVVGIIIVVIISVIGIPTAINECYKRGGRYITFLGAEAILSYYGTILSTFVSAATIAITILFTRKQIARDSYLKNEDRKWSNIDNIFAKALDSINPMRPLIETMDTGMVNPAQSILNFQKYQVACRITTDQLNAFLNRADYPKVKALIDDIDSSTEGFSKICDKAIACYSKLIDFSNRSTAEETLKMEATCPGAFSKDTLDFDRAILNNTDGMTIEMINKSIIEVNEKMTLAYVERYRNLLQLKGQTFESINIEIQKKADSLLLFNKKNNP